MKFLFPKTLRLLTNIDFQLVFQQHKKIKILHIEIFSRCNLLDYPRIGISISKKYVKHAYKRNRIKRLIREDFRLRQYILPKMDFIIVIKKDFIKNITQKILEQLWSHHYHLVQKF